MKHKKIITEDFFIGNLGNIEASNEILSAYEKVFNKEIENIVKSDLPGLVGDLDSPIEKIRKCHISWLDVSKSNFIEYGLKKILKNVNGMIWKMNLDDEWESNIQFTKYIGKGDHYNWHKDYYEIDNFDNKKYLRRISIVYCLSKKSDYIGGEFQIKTKKGETYTTKFDFGDFIVFPSDTLHRVKPLKSGTRITMVGWYK